jgi:hypothetical protein
MPSSRAIASFSHGAGSATLPVSIFAICDSEHPTRLASSSCVQRRRRRAVRTALDSFTVVFTAFVLFGLPLHASAPAMFKKFTMRDPENAKAPVNTGAPRL